MSPPPHLALGVSLELCCVASKGERTAHPRGERISVGRNVAAARSSGGDPAAPVPLGRDAACPGPSPAENGGDPGGAKREAVRLEQEGSVKV